MAERGRKPVECYVYRIFDGHETLYVGKGSGRRLKQQIKNFGMTGEIIETCPDDATAFARERHWIKSLMPTMNVSPGGNGGTTTPKVPAKIIDIVKPVSDMGSRKFAAQFLITKIGEANCALYGLSKLDVFRLREVASGPRC